MITGNFIYFSVILLKSKHILLLAETLDMCSTNATDRSADEDDFIGLTITRSENFNGNLMPSMLWTYDNEAIDDTTAEQNATFISSYIEIQGYARTFGYYVSSVYFEQQLSVGPPADRPANNTPDYVSICTPDINVLCRYMFN